MTITTKINYVFLYDPAEIQFYSIKDCLFHKKIIILMN